MVRKGIPSSVAKSLKFRNFVIVLPQFSKGCISSMSAIATGDLDSWVGERVSLFFSP
jgi:hypothetical protein